VSRKKKVRTGHRGQCVDIPTEDEATAKTTRIRGYPVREYRGLIFAYLRDGETPEFPRYPDFEEGGELWVEAYTRACNFVNNMENDPVHIPFAHRESALFHNRPVGAKLGHMTQFAATYAFATRPRQFFDSLAGKFDNNCLVLSTRGLLSQTRKDGRTIERHSTVLRGENGKYLGRVWFFRDITAHRQTEAALRDLADHDPLTGVANRRFFLGRFTQEFARARRYERPLSMISFDIDHFKRINDKHGHAAGDEVLKSLCVTCAKLLREVDLLGRLGGEEFAVLLPETALEGAHLIAERLRQFVARQVVTVKNQTIQCTISAGVATLLAADTMIDDQLRRADEALYRAKNGGRNRVEVNS
jgi:diguanylate cyclase (GGDEF)-like protein